ncbi:MAG: hypothetical protein JO057_04755 [Chloroflexi bacterium]|nr:hypothetical protein [Chloroflexota bacterium]
MTEILIVQHADKEPTPDDPGLSELGRQQATTAAVNIASLAPLGYADRALTMFRSLG